MDSSGTGPRLAAWGRGAAVAALVLAALNWVGWSIGRQVLTRLNSAWPHMVPWTALWLAVLAVAILLQYGRPSRGRVWLGRVVAVAVAAYAGVVLAMDVSGRSLGGFDRVWFGEAVRTLHSAWPGRPNVPTAATVLLLAGAAAVIRCDRWWAELAWVVGIIGALVAPVVSIAAYLFDARPLMYAALPTAIAALLLITALSGVRPDRPPIDWLLARPDREALLRLYGLAVGYPIVVALSRLTFRSLGRSERAAFALSVMVCTVLAAVIGFRLRRGEQDLLIEKEQLARERAEAEMRYRMYADNAVDVIIHLRGLHVVWVSPSVEPALGGPAQRWLDVDFSRYIHPDDLGALARALKRLAGGESVQERFRVCSVDGDYHWVDGHGKPHVDADGHPDGLIAALRIVDDRVAVEQQLEKLARFDTLTGLAHRGEAIARLEAALEHPPAFGVHIGIIFCDVDHFKEINDTWGHGIGDVVLATLATRIRESVRPGDTVGRTGGDEMIVVLPGVHSIDELGRISEAIRSRTAEPIHESGRTIHATLSIGATIAVPGETVSSVMARADEAMYQAKLGARNTVVLVEPGAESASGAEV